MKGNVLLLRWIIVAAVGGFVHEASAADFRVDNQVFTVDQQEPLVRSTTVFGSAAVYDFLADPAEVTMFDPRGGRIVLLDLSGRVKTELTTAQVEAFVERLRQRAAAQPKPLLRFLANPEFEASYDEQTGRVELTSPWLTYRVETVAAVSEEVSRRYREFSDWHAQLNALVHPGAHPPFARLKLNEILAQHGRIPRRVELEIRTAQGPSARRIRLRSVHRFAGQLAESDRDRVAQVEQFLIMFPPVHFSDYQRRLKR